MRSLAASFLVSLFVSMTLIVTTCATVSYAKTAHACAPTTPPPLPGPLVPPPATPGLLTINEVLWTPHSAWDCAGQGKRFTYTDSWVEIYNSGNQAFDLYASHTRLDSGPKTNAFSFSPGTAIAPKGYLVLFPRAYPLFVATQSMMLRLLLSNTVIDEVVLPALGPDQSYARMPDGSNNWQIVNAPTIDASNTVLQATPTSVNAPRGNGGVHSGSSGNGQSNGVSQRGSGPDGVSSNNGAQPVWNTLHLPTPASPVVASSSTFTAAAPVSAATNEASDLPRKVFLSLLLTLLALAALWCWRVFRKT